MVGSSSRLPVTAVATTASTGTSTQRARASYAAPSQPPARKIAANIHPRAISRRRRSDSAPLGPACPRRAPLSIVGGLNNMVAAGAPTRPNVLPAGESGTPRRRQPSASFGRDHVLRPDTHRPATAKNPTATGDADEGAPQGLPAQRAARAPDTSPEGRSPRNNTQQANAVRTIAMEFDRVGTCHRTLGSPVRPHSWSLRPRVRADAIGWEPPCSLYRPSGYQPHISAAESMPTRK